MNIEAVVMGIRIVSGLAMMIVGMTVIVAETTTTLIVAGIVSFSVWITATVFSVSKLVDRITNLED